MIDTIEIPRLRMFAGPNGSGKSTMKSVLKPELLGIYVNPDEIEKEINRNDSLDLDDFGVTTYSILKTSEKSLLQWVLTHCAMKRLVTMG